MKTIDRFILKSYAGPMVLTFFISIFVLLMQSVWLYIDEMVGKGLEWNIIAEFLFWIGLSLIPMALPLSTLLAAIMTMGNLGENNELLAIKSAGVSLQRVMTPLFILVFMISCLAFYISNNLLPLSSLKMRSLRYDIGRKRPDMMVDPGVFTNDIPNYSVKVSHKDHKTNLLKDLLVYDHKDYSGNRSVTVADSGYINMTKDSKFIIVTLYNGNTYQEEDRTRVDTTYPSSHRKFKMQQFLIPVQEWTRTDEDLFKGSSSMMLTIQDLNREIDSLKEIQNLAAKSSVSSFIYSSGFNSYVEMDTIAKDRARLTYFVNVDSIYQSFTDERKAVAISMAVEKAKMAKDQVVFLDNSSGMESQRRRIAQNEVEWHMKFTLSAACLIFFFIGAPLGAIIRKGGLGMPTVLSLILFLFYWVLFTTGRKMAIQGEWNPAVAMWLPTLILLPLGIFLTYKSTTDSALLNTEKYVDFFRQIFSRKKKKSSEVESLHFSGWENVTEETVEQLSQSVCSFNERCMAAITANLPARSYLSLAETYAWVIDDKEWLVSIKEEYDSVLKEMLASTQNNEAFMVLLAQYPELKPQKYIYPKKQRRILLALGVLVVPFGAMLYLIISYKYRQCRGVLMGIVMVNQKIENYFSHNKNE